MVQVTADVGPAASSAAFEACRSGDLVLPAAAAAAAALDLHEELRHTPVRGGCPHWPDRLRLVSDRGHFVRGRCGSTNQCDYCARIAAVENSEMLALDAMYGAPELWCVLTTPIATLDTSELQIVVKRLVQALRRTLGRRVEYASILEYTTGYGPLAQGKRRPHWNLLLKGVTVAQIEGVRAVIERVWCAGAQASPKAQYVGPIAEAGGLMRYLALHFQKESQRPPDGFTGQRFNTSRGYYNRRTRAEMRRVARESLRGKRDLRQARIEGHEGQAAERRARELTQARWDTHWRLYQRDRETVESNEGEALSSGSWLVPEVWAIAFDADVEHLEAGPSTPPRGADPDTPVSGEGPLSPSEGLGAPSRQIRRAAGPEAARGGGTVPRPPSRPPGGPPPRHRRRTSPAGRPPEARQGRGRTAAPEGPPTTQSDGPTRPPCRPDG